MVLRPDNPIRFQNQHLDAETGLYKMGQRYYDPSLQRWTQKDPLNLFQEPRQGNRYAFVGGNPVNEIDPTGMFGIDLGIDFSLEEALTNALIAAGGYVVCSAATAGATAAGTPAAGGAAAAVCSVLMSLHMGSVLISATKTTRCGPILSSDA
jgi:RHS repeat-associated protein